MIKPNKTMLLALMVTITAQASPKGELPDVLLEQPIERASAKASLLSPPRMGLDEIHAAFEALDKQGSQAAEQAQELTMWLSLFRQKNVVMQSALERFFDKYGRNGEKWDCNVNAEALKQARSLLTDMQSHLRFLDEHCPGGCDEERQRTELNIAVLESLSARLIKDNQAACR